MCHSKNKFSTRQNTLQKSGIIKAPALPPFMTLKAMLATMNVTSLYANIPYYDGKAAYLKWIQENGLHSDLQPQYIAQIIHFMLIYNRFIFNNKYFSKPWAQLWAKDTLEYTNLQNLK